MAHAEGIGPTLARRPRLRSASAADEITPIHDLGSVGWWNPSWLSRTVEVQRDARWAGNIDRIIAAFDDGTPLAAGGFINPEMSVSPLTGAMLVEVFGAFDEGKLKLWLISYPIFTEVTATISMRVPVWRRRRTEEDLRRRLADLEDEVLTRVRRAAQPRRRTSRPRLRVAQ
jgi:hypothetical protein